LTSELKRVDKIGVLAVARRDHLACVAAARLDQVRLGALAAHVDLWPYARRPCRQGKRQRRAGRDMAGIVQLVVQRVEHQRDAQQLVQPQQLGQHKAIFVGLDRHAPPRELGQALEARRKAMQRRRAVAVGAADVQRQHRIGPGAQRVEQLRPRDDRGGPARGQVLIGCGQRHMQAHMHGQADAMQAREPTRLGQQLGALLDLPAELGHVGSIQVGRQVVGQTVAADALLGQVEQQFAQIQQADA
jgi:hypothetical protein